MQHDYKLCCRMLLAALVMALCSVQSIFASAKAGSAEVWDGQTATIALADVYKRTLQRSTNISYQWRSENSSYVSVTSSTQYYAVVKGLRPTESCKVYFGAV